MGETEVTKEQKVEEEVKKLSEEKKGESSGKIKASLEKIKELSDEERVPYIQE